MRFGLNSDDDNNNNNDDDDDDTHANVFTAVIHDTSHEFFTFV